MTELLIKIAFYGFGSLTLASILVMLFTKNVLYTAFSLLFTFLGLACLYALTSADFVAITQIVVYVGGVLVLLLFGIMLSNQSTSLNPKEIYQNISAPKTGHSRIFVGVLSGLSIFLLLIYTIIHSDFSHRPWIQTAKQSSTIIKESTVKSLGINFMTEYILAFELAAILLLAALVGAVMLTNTKENSEMRKS